MTMIQTEEVLADHGKERALEFHIAGRFYPPFPEYVKDSIREGFKLYWDRQISLDELRDKCYLRATDSLYHYFGCFLNEEDQ